MAQHSILHECILQAVLNQNKEYDCANQFELKKKIISVFNEFKVKIVDPIDNTKCIRTNSYWANHGIKKQTICSWRSMIKNDSIHKQGKMKLNYAFYFALLVETNLADAIYFMATAGYVYKIYPLNHDYYNSPEARCFIALAYVYSCLILTNTDLNASRFERLELADWYIDTNDPSLLEELLL